MDFDEELKAALKRREPPEGFAERVLARAQSPAATRLPSWRERWTWLISGRWPVWVMAGVVAVIVLAPSSVEYHRRTQGELAKKQVMLALEIAGSKLNYVQKKALEIGSGGVLENQ
jgi:hypothetical protein